MGEYVYCMSELWKDINGYEGLYQISNKGKIRKLRFINNICNKEKIFELTPQIINSGYQKVMLYKNGEYKNALVHRLVAEAFVENPDNKKIVNHKDGDKTNNYADNLEWVTHGENMTHAYKNGLAYSAAKGRFGADSKKSIRVNMLDKTSEKVLNQFGSLIDAAHYIGVNKSSHICNCCKGKLKTAYGYKWEYANEV